MSTDSHNPYLEMHRLFRRLHQRNRFIDKQPEAKVTLTEAHFLIELSANPVHNQKSLSKLLGLDQSSMSRVMKGLQSHGLIQTKQNNKDGRHKNISLTSKGIKVLKQIDNVTNQTFKDFSCKMPGKQIKSLVLLFKDIADGYGHPPGIKRDVESSFRTEQRRITRCFRLLGPSAFGSDLSSTKWQVLSEVCDSPIPILAKQLSKRLATPANTVSIVLKDLETQGFIKRKESIEDKRATLISATESGKKRSLQIEEAASIELSRALSVYSSREIKERLSALSHYVNDTDLPNIHAHESLRLLTSPDERREARSFIINQLCYLNLAQYAPATLVGEEHLAIGFFSSVKLKAVFDFKVKPNLYELTAAGWLSGGLTEVKKILKDQIPILLKGLPGTRPMQVGFVPLYE